jgi:diaminohydroxyphosphoribosylaminopyrimidine deaminase / 5-amino-6-(5-phosphoribosylamino)uracil reductase
MPGQTFDEVMMRRALFHAARGAGRTTPNPMVGAVVVSSDGVVVGHGWHERAGEAHAEVHALEAAGARARGATLYVTLEPCCHTGRTGPCTRRVIDAGVARVVAAMIDPDPRVRGRGLAELTAHGIVIDQGVCEAEAMRLNQPFITVVTHGRPLVIAKAATSLDARVAAGPGQRTSLTSAAANRKTQLLRASVDAVAVGSETVLVDDPLLTVRECQRARPLVRVVFDRRLRTPRKARLFSTLSAGPVIIVTSAKDHDRDRVEALEQAGATVIEAETIAGALEALTAHNVSSVLVEGGPTLQQALWRAELLDRVHLIIAPHMIGDGGIKWIDAGELPLSSLTAVVTETRGPDVWIEADVHRHR